MIKTFKHKRLKKFFESGSTAGIQAGHSKRIRMKLAAIDTAHVIEDINLPGFKLRPPTHSTPESQSTIFGKPYYVPRSNPDGFSVNVRCLNKESFKLLSIVPFHGRNWERHAGSLSHLSQ